MSHDLRILQVLPALEAGGVERATIDMVCALKKTSRETFVASAGGSLTRLVCEAGAQHLEIPLNTKNPVRMIKNACVLRSFIQRHQIQLVHARSRAPAWSTWLAARWAGIPWITTYHGVHRSSHCVKNFYNAIMTRGDAVIAISDFMRQHMMNLHKTNPDKIHLIYEGIDLDFFNADLFSEHEIQQLREQWHFPPDAKILLMPGRLTSWKGQASFIEAFSLLKTPHVYGVICGSDQGRYAYTQELKNLIQKFGLGKSIIFLDNQADMRPLYLAADVVVTPSTQEEAFGRINAECLAMGALLVTTHLGATPEICGSSMLEHMVQPKNPQELAGKIDEALALSAEQKYLRIQMTQQHVQSCFSLERMYSETINLYKSCIHLL